MSLRRVTRSASWRLSARIDRPEVVLLAAGLAGLAAYGWYASPFWLAVVVGLQLALGGLGAVWIIGPATARLGFARYATTATTAIAITLFGRAVVGGIGLYLIPVALVVLWAVLRLELELQTALRGRLGLELLLVAVVFAAADGSIALAPREQWVDGLALLSLVAAVPALRMSEARGRFGAHAVGEGLLHLLAVVQVAAAVQLLALPALVAAALVALTFHAWSGAAEALEGGGSARSVAIEFGALAVLGLVVALLLQGR
jgi:hypothetical protein